MSGAAVVGGRRAPLRRRLVLVVLGAVAVVAATMGALSTLALRGTLIDQLDVRLLAAAGRATAAQEGDPRPEPPDGLAPPQDGLTPGDLPDDEGPPPGLVTLGQGAGTLNVAVRGGVATAGYLDQSGTVQTFDTDQVQTLLAVPVDGEPHTVGLGELGSWRVIAFETQDADTVITGLAMAEVSSTVSDYLVAEGLVAVTGLAVAGLAGAGLVRRELDPLERVAATATRVSEQPLDRGAVTLDRVPEADTDAATEVGQVGAALNRLLGHVEGALAARHASEMQVRQFVADASHELRTPLASIRGYAELVRRLPDELPEDAVRAMGRVESESRRMTALVEDLLLLARLDAGRSLERTEVDLAALAADAVADAHVAGRGHVWRLELPGEPGPDGTGTDGPGPDGTGTDGSGPDGTGTDGSGPDGTGTDGSGPDGSGTGDPGLTSQEAGEDPTTTVVGDDHRLRQVLVNLLANARVHTPAGTTVTTSVRRDGGEVVVEVRDDGPGIAAELVPRLFQRFARGDEARAPGAGSTGLGLAIVDAVVAAHGGRVEVDATPGATTFTVRLPAAG